MKRILMLTANPKDTTKLRLVEEEKEIRYRLRLAGYGETPIHLNQATTTRELIDFLLNLKPEIVHFSGHGAGEAGLVFENENRQEKLIKAEDLADLFEAFSKYVKCVVLNACYAEFQAKAVAKHIDHVIGMHQKISDHAAIEFSSGFYSALGAGESIEFAHKLGCIAIQLAGLSKQAMPVLFLKGEMVLSNKNDEISKISSDTRHFYEVKKSDLEESVYNKVVEHKTWLDTNKLKGNKADFNHLDLSHYHFQGKNLSKANFERAKLYRVNFESSILNESCLGATDLAFADLRKASLAKSKLWYANLYCANAEGTKFTDADIYGAKFEKAILIDADFTGADIGECNFHDANIAGAILLNVKRMTGDTIFNAINFHEAIFQDDFWKTVIKNRRDLKQWDRIKEKLKLHNDKSLRNKPFTFSDDEINIIKS